MAHYAEIDKNDIVVFVIVVDNAVEGDSGDPAKQEILGLAWLATFPPTAGKTYVKTSYNASMRKNYAGIGYTYRRDVDAFVSPKPYPSWLLNDKTAQWDPPIPYPNDGKRYHWDEKGQQWVPE